MLPPIVHNIVRPLKNGVTYGDVTIDRVKRPAGGIVKVAGDDRCRDGIDRIIHEGTIHKGSRHGIDIGFHLLDEMKKIPCVTMMANSGVESKVHPEKEK